jgi:hypothetical protein
MKCRLIPVLCVSAMLLAVSSAGMSPVSEEPGLGCWDALNLDGGPSTQLVVKLPAMALSRPGGWGVPNALVVVPGKR